MQRGDDFVDAGPDLDSRTVALQRSIRRVAAAPRGNRPRRSAAEKGNELPPPHVRRGPPAQDGITSNNDLPATLRQT